ncbi:MAG: PorT family protein [Chitinophagaceae bacterium]|jgi:hypothetical protein|nr:PorT family protein [Chitinophagaceae bacterium]
MRKNWLLVLFLSFSMAGSAQDLEKIDGFGVYFKGGVNLANFVNWDDDEPTKSFTGFSGGMGFYIQLGKSTRKSSALALEGLFSSQGFQVEEAGVTSKVRITYFNIPLLYRKYFGHLYLTAGPQYGIFVGGKVINDNGESYVKDGIYSKNTWSGLVGLGYNFGDKNTRQIDFGFEATYGHGLTKVRTDFVKARQSVVNVSMFIPVAFVAEMFGQ